MTFREAGGRSQQPALPLLETRGQSNFSVRWLSDGVSISLVKADVELQR